MPELAKTYDPVGTEARWQQAWDDQGAFHPDPKAPGEPFSVVIPPPNVTGSLHMGRKGPIWPHGVGPRRAP